jgi:hypothetical protein
MRTSIKIDKPIFIQAVESAEKDGPLDNRNQLYSRVADIYNGLISVEFPQISFSVASLRISEYALEIKTPTGKRGRQKPQDFTNVVESSSSDADPKNIRQMRATIPRQYHNLIDSVEQGCLKSVVFLKCLECMNYDKLEIKECICIDCPNWSFRPFQTKE